MRRPVVLALAALALGAASCSLLVTFDDKPAGGCHDGGCADASKPADAHPPSDGPARDAGSDADGGGLDPCALLPSGALCAIHGGCSCGFCQQGKCAVTAACPDGLQWEAGVDTARCCAGAPVVASTDSNCGVCGVKCAAPQTSSSLDGHYLCLGCTKSAECWSGCCSVNPSPQHCAVSDCATGACPAGVCPPPSRCVQTGAGQPNYCTYD